MVLLWRSRRNAPAGAVGGKLRHGKWHKNVGDLVAKGEILFTYETDKAVFDESAPVAGTLLARFYEEGDDVPCLRNVCVIGRPEKTFPRFLLRR